MAGIGRTHYALITTQASEVDADLTDYPMSWDLSLITDTRWWDNVKSDGGDLVMYTEGGDRVALEVGLDFDSTSKVGMVYWLSSPSSTLNQKWKLWCGNPAASQPAEDAAFGREAVWNSNYTGVWHMEEDPSGSAPQMTDATSNDIDATTNGSMASGDSVTGQIGQGVDFDGVGQYLTFSSATPTVNTVSFWFKYASSAEAGALIYCGSDAFDSTAWNWGAWTGSPNAISFVAKAGAYQVTTTFSSGAWTKFTMVRNNGSGMEVFKNGASIGTGASGTSTGGILRSMKSGTYYPIGSLDEIRLNDSALSDDWITTEYNNQSAPGTFNVYGGVFNAHRNRIMSAA